MSWYLTVLKKYAVFSGRARRAEYWMFVLFNAIVSIILMVIGNLLVFYVEFSAGAFIYPIYSVAVLIPSFAVTVRRLHDVDKSGWFFFIVFIPVIGVIWLLILAVKEGGSEDNQYGSNPKAVTG